MKATAMLASLLPTASCWTVQPQRCSPDGLASQSNRRAFLSGLGFTAALAIPSSPAWAGACQGKDGPCKAEKYATGTKAERGTLFVPYKTVEQITAEVKEQVFTRLSAAYREKDWQSVGAQYTPGATIVDATVKSIKPVFLKGSEAADHFSAAPAVMEPKLILISCTAEGEDIAHAIYSFEYTGGRYRGAMKLVFTDAGGWKVDEDVFPLDDGRANAMIQPKRDEWGHVWMGLDPARKPKA